MKKYNPPPRRNFHIGEEGSINFDIGRKFPYGPPPPLFHLFTSLSLPRFSYFFPFLRRDLARFLPRVPRTRSAHNATKALFETNLLPARALGPRREHEANRTEPTTLHSLPSPPRTELFCTTASSFPSPGRSLDIYVPLHF